MESLGKYPVNNTQLIIYLVFTLASIVISLFLYLYMMECSDIQRNDRKDFNSLMYHFIAGRDSQITHYKDKEEVLNQKLM